jgi:hypothetical protein
MRGQAFAGVFDFLEGAAENALDRGEGVVGVHHVLPPGRLAHEDIAGRGVGDDGGDDAGAADGDDDRAAALVVEEEEKV